MLFCFRLDSAVVEAFAYEPQGFRFDITFFQLSFEKNS